MPTPIPVDFPLRGVWIAPNTPGTRIPSHGVDMLGERYAYDFGGVDPNSRSNRVYRPNPLQYLIAGVRLRDCYGWGAPIYSATEGVVVQAEDGWPERDPVHIARDIPNMIKNARIFQDGPGPDLRLLTGNYVIVESSAGYAVYVHAQTGSIQVSKGERVQPGQQLARVGHSGNSTAPHLHFHLMDDPDPWKAQGILCSFREYEVLENDTWHRVENGIPKATERIRRLPCLIPN